MPHEYMGTRNVSKVTNKAYQGSDAHPSDYAHNSKVPSLCLTILIRIRMYGFLQELTQTLSSNGTATTEEILKMPPFGTQVSSFLRGNITPVNQQVGARCYLETLFVCLSCQADEPGSRDSPDHAAAL
jgi:hypothetical protein